MDPKLSELQSQYARAALAEFQKTQTGPGPQPPSAPASPVSPQSQSSPHTAVPMGSVLIKHLCAVGRSWLTPERRCAERLSTRVLDAYQRGDTVEHDWRMANIMEGSWPLLVTLDSGAAALVCPPDTFPDEHQYPADGRLAFVAANGEMVPELYKVQPVVATEEGHLKRTQFSVAAVNKVLMSAAEVANRGHRIVLNPVGEDSWIEDYEDGSVMKLYQQDGVYVQKLRVVHPHKVGFSGVSPVSRGGLPDRDDGGG